MKHTKSRPGSYVEDASGRKRAMRISIREVHELGAKLSFSDSVAELRPVCCVIVVPKPWSVLRC